MQRKRGLALGRPFGVPLVAHVSWVPAAGLLVAHLAISAYGGERLVTAIALGVATAVVFFGCVVAHELAHALVGRVFGSRTDTTTLYVFGGVADGEPTAPIRDAITAAAGPVTTGLIGAAFAFTSSSTNGLVADVLWTLALANFAFTGVNLLPGLPLDGGRVFADLRWRRSGNRQEAERSAVRWGRTIAVFCAIVGLWLVFGTGLFASSTAFGLWLVLIAAFALIETRAPREREAPVAIPDETVGAWARPFAGRIPIHDTIPASGGPYAVADEGRLAGVLTRGVLTRAPGSNARDVMVPWSGDISLSSSEPIATALERLAARPDGVLVVLDERGVVKGVLDEDVVRERLERA